MSYLIGRINQIIQYNVYVIYTVSDNIDIYNVTIFFFSGLFNELKG